MVTRQVSRQEINDIKGTVDVRSLLESYGATIFLDTAENLRSNCIIHGGTNTSSLSYSTRTGFFKCFGECGFKGDVFALVQQVDGCSFMESVAKVSAFSARNKTNGFKKTTAAVTTDPWIEGLARAYAPVETNEVINSPLVESALRNPYNPYVATGKFNAETMAYFQVGYCDDNDYFRDRAIITIHNEDGNLIGFSGRDMTGTESNKYRIKKGFKKGNCLYNLHRARNYISRKNPMVLVEGFGQAWRLHEAGVRTAVALMGKELTDEQYKLIMKYTTSIVLALDFDEPGIHATKKIVDRLEDKIDVRVMVSTQHPDTDLGDMEIEDVTEIYENSIPTYLWYNEIYRGLTK